MANESETGRVSRRALLGYGALGVGALGLGIGGGIAGFNALTAQHAKNPSPPLDGSPGLTGVNPPVLRSQNGALTVDVTAAVTETMVGNQRARLMTFNGISPAPTWVVRPGDTITVNFSNALGQSTNLHTHGLHVSPSGASDNVFVDIPDGGTHQYVYQLGTDHPTGIAWYHPHMHGMTADQVFAGLFGAIIIEDVTAASDVTDRVLIVSDLTLRNDGEVATPNSMSKMMGREGDLILVNGQPAPEYAFASGSVERWRIVNACTSRYLDLAATGASLELLGMDTGHFETPKPINRVRVLPGNRADVVATFTTENASLTYTTVAHPDAMNMGSSQSYTDLPIATFSAGASAISHVAVESFPLATDLRSRQLDSARTLTLAMPGMNGMMMGNGGMGNGNFTINGASFDPTVINESVTLGTIEEWTIVNTSTMDHPFHLHVWPMQLISVGTEQISGVEYQDVVNVPANSQTVVRIHFTEYPGKTVYHCHILDHEDLGMMGVIEAS